MAFSALDSELLGPLFASDAMRDVFSDRRRLAAMLEVEAALARAEAKFRLVPKELAAAIDRVAAEDLDPTALGRQIAVAGVPTIPFVKAVQTKLPEPLEAHFHRGATTQDIADTALVLQMRAAFTLIADDLAAIIVGLARLARALRTTPCVGRTFGQHAAPITVRIQGRAMAVRNCRRGGRPCTSARSRSRRLARGTRRHPRRAR